MTAIEHKELRGITIKNLVVTIMGTASIVTSVVTTYLGLRSDIHDLSITQKTESRIYDLKIKALEDELVIIQDELDDLKYQQTHPVAAKRVSPTLLSVASPRQAK